MQLSKLNVDSSQPAKQLYESAFPLEERRPWISILENNKNDDFDFFIIQDGGLFVGIISIWQFEEFNYIEHFAISKELRSKGFGSEVIDLIKQKYYKPFVIEVELPQKPQAIKRISFYERLGFCLRDDFYMQPPYTEHLPSLQMNIMTTDNTLSFDKIKQTLYKQVYNYAN